MIEQPVFDILCRNKEEAEIIEKAFKKILNRFLGQNLTLNTLVKMIDTLDRRLLTQYGLDPFVIWSIHHPELYDYQLLDFKDVVDLYNRFCSILPRFQVQYRANDPQYDKVVEGMLKELKEYGVIYKTVSIDKKYKIVTVFLHMFLNHASITDTRQKLPSYNFPSTIEW